LTNPFGERPCPKLGGKGGGGDAYAKGRCSGIHKTIGLAFGKEGDTNYKVSIWRFEDTGVVIKKGGSGGQLKRLRRERVPYRPRVNMALNVVLFWRLRGTSCESGRPNIRQGDSFPRLWEKIGSRGLTNGPR